MQKVSNIEKNGRIENFEAIWLPAMLLVNNLNGAPSLLLLQICNLSYLSRCSHFNDFTCQRFSTRRNERLFSSDAEARPSESP